MLTVVAAAAAIGRSCSAGNKGDIESGAVIVVVGEYSKIELCIRVAINTGMSHLLFYQGSNEHIGSIIIQVI